MTRISFRLTLTLTCFAVLTACGSDTKSTAPAENAIARADAKSNSNQRELAKLRQVTARFHSIDAAKKAGYETQVTPCWAHHAAGSMGYHFGRMELFDATVDLLNPETVMYEPQAGGHMRLVGMEYIVPLDAWAEAGHNLDDPADVPELLGEKFTRHSSLPIFKLHVWLWRDNPSGRFADWNPKVSCEHAAEREMF